MASQLVLPALDLLRGLAMEHLKGVCEQNATNCLMETYTHCIPGAGAVSMADRTGGQHFSAMLSCVETTGKTSMLILVMPV